MNVQHREVDLSRPDLPLGSSLYVFINGEISNVIYLPTFSSAFLIMTFNQQLQGAVKPKGWICLTRQLSLRVRKFLKGQCYSNLFYFSKLSMVYMSIKARLKIFFELVSIIQTHQQCGATFYPMISGHRATFQIYSDDIRRASWASSAIWVIITWAGVHSWENIICFI